MTAHNWIIEQENRRLTDVGDSELGKGAGSSKFTKNSYLGWLELRGH